MATMDRTLSEEKITAREAGYSLGWLDQLENRRIAPAADTSDDGKGADLPESSDNLTARPYEAIPRPGIPQIGAYS